MFGKEKKIRIGGNGGTVRCCANNGTVRCGAFWKGKDVLYLLSGFI